MLENDERRTENKNLSKRIASENQKLNYNKM